MDKNISDGGRIASRRGTFQKPLQPEGNFGSSERLTAPASDQFLDRSLLIEKIREALGDMVLQTGNGHSTHEAPVGETPLLPTNLILPCGSLDIARELSRAWVKWEGASVSGSHKDRIALESVAEAIEQGKSVVSVATCGNYGYAVCIMVAAAKRAGFNIDANVFMPLSFHSPKTQLMRSLGANVELLGGAYEDVVKESTKLAESNPTWYDANPGGGNLQTQIDAYARIAEEIVHQLGEAPAFCLLPISNGTTLCGVARGFAKLREAGKIASTPSFIGVTVADQNPIDTSFKRGKDYEPLRPEDLFETEVNEPLINWDSTEGRETLAIIKATDGFTSGVTDEDLQSAADWCKRSSEGALPVMPAGAATIAGVLTDTSLRLKIAERGGPVVLVFTARESD
jgi:threonine synthase